MHAFSCQRIEVDGQGGGQGFALTRAHLCNFALVQGDATDQLHVKVAHFHDALRALANHGKGFGQNIIHGFALLESGFERIGLCAQVIVAQGFQCTFQCVDLRDGFAIGFEHPIVAAAKNRSQ